MRMRVFFLMLTVFLTAFISFTPINVTANNFSHTNSCYPNHNIRGGSLEDFKRTYVSYIKRVESFDYYDYADVYGISVPDCVICTNPSQSTSSINTMHSTMFLSAGEQLFMYLWSKVGDERMESLAEMYINHLQKQYEKASSPRSRNMLIGLALGMNKKKAEMYDCTWRYEYNPIIDDWFVF